MRRRRCVQATGLAVLTAIAGCTGNGGGDGNGGDGGDGAPALTGDDYPAVDAWLTETDVGAAAPNYDGSIVDRRDQEAITVGVGTGDTGTEFDPAAVAVDAGTTVRWEWTGEGGAHNVEAEPDDQIGESDYEFSSGDPVDEEGETYEQVLDEPGVALYHCEPHLTVGMKGAVVVAESG
ncbi:halocyanin domain-containing protein [Halobellus sp. GM3]|uniref:halocyanin domain-containing protein n=1 Tax=Halobellus sp. GM3 TaxID=3458410 RepID=UPI00403DA35E